MVIVLPLLALLASGSFFFAAAESSLFSLGMWRARRLAERPDPRGLIVQELLSRPEDLLATLVLGNASANALLTAVGVLAALHGSAPVVAILLGMFLGLLLLCEVTPKALAVRQPEAWALRVARGMRFLVRITRPIRRIAQGAINRALGMITVIRNRTALQVSDEEYADLVELAHQQGALDASEKELILQVLSLDQRAARDVMRPRAQMVCLPDDLLPDPLVLEARKARHHRIPLYDETPDNIVAVLNTRTLLLDPAGGIDEALEFPSFVPESMNLLSLFQSLQIQQRGLAIVLDEFGSPAGLITIEDILEAVVGPIRDEGEAQGWVIETLGPRRWRANGSMRIDDFRRAYPTLAEVEGVDTLGGLVVKLSEVVPSVGESVTFSGLRWTVQSADERRVREVLIESEGGAA